MYSDLDNFSIRAQTGILIGYGIYHIHMSSNHEYGIHQLVRKIHLYL